jgi:hypothetical protein
MIQIITQITAPYFETRLNCWIFRGFTFNKNGTEFLFFQTLSVFGSHTDRSRMAQNWKLYKVTNDTKLECITRNGIKSDAGYLKMNDNPDSISSRNGLTVEDITELETYAKKESLQEDQINNAVINEIQPLLEEQVLVIEEDMKKLGTLAISDLVKTMTEINNLGNKICEIYPRSNEELKKRAFKVREAYAKVKYPKLYAELKKVHEDEKYQKDEDDDIVGFGIRSIYTSLFYKYFAGSTTDTWEDRSPFEGQFKKSILFKEVVIVQ